MGTKTRLTDAAIKNATKPQSGQAEIWDATISGFGVRVTPHGVKSFVLLYRHHGKPRRWTMGRYPALSLAQARVMATDALEKIEQGRDPQADVAEAQALTFDVALERFIATYCKTQQKASTAAETERNLRATFADRWGKRPLSSITKADLLAVTDAAIKRGHPSAARHAHSNARKFFAWCVERGLLDASPMDGLKPPVRAKNRAKVLAVQDVAAVLKAADGIGWPFGAIVRLLAMTGQRRAEVAGMAWDELDLERGLWVIPAERVKNGRSHALPLGPMALDFIKALPRSTSRLVFPARGNDDAPFSGWSKAKAQLDKDAGVTGWTLHDLRRSMATGCAGLGIPPHIVERILNHAGGTFAGVAGVYNRFEYQDEMREALTKWEAALMAGQHVGPVRQHSGENAPDGRVEAIA